MKRVLTLPIVAVVALLAVCIAPTTIASSDVNDFYTKYLLNMVYPKEIVEKIEERIEALEYVAKSLRLREYTDPVDAWICKYLAKVIEEYVEEIKKLLDEGILYSDLVIIDHAVDELKAFNKSLSEHVSEIDFAVTLFEELKKYMSMLATQKFVVIGRVVGIIGDKYLLYGSLYTLIPSMYPGAKIMLEHLFDGYIIVEGIELATNQKVVVLGDLVGTEVVIPLGVIQVPVLYAYGYNPAP